MPRIRRCRLCGRPVNDDGYGELVHEETNQYGCDPDGRHDGGYPVAE